MRSAPGPDGARLAYDVRGHGPPLLLVAPLAGSIELWGRFRDELARRARVISYDHPGLGRSSRAPLGVTTRTLAADARAVLDDAGVDRADVVGESLGGMIATWLAADEPARVRRLVLASTPLRGLALVGSARAVVRGARLAGCVVRGDRALGRCVAAGLLTPAFRAARPAEAARIERVIAGAPRSRRSLVALAGAALRHDGRAALEHLVAPTLVLCGERDRLVGIDLQRRQLARLGGASFEVIAGAGHALTLEAPVEAAARVAAFLDGEPAS